MPGASLVIRSRPPLKEARLVMGLGGWMDGGSVSTATVAWLVRALQAAPLAEIDPTGFYIYSFPGNMEVSAMFRPHVRIQKGIIRSMRFPDNEFFADSRSNTILFSGKEPNFRWQEFADCIFRVVDEFDVRRIYFIGSVAGVVPHTREPRILCSTSTEELRDEMLRDFAIPPSNYEGPGSFVTYLTIRAAARQFPLASLVAEVPAYVEGANPICIDSVIRRLSNMLGVQVAHDDLRKAAEVFEQKLNKVLEGNDEMLQLIHKLEADYDNEVFDTQLGDLRSWLEQKGIRLD